MTVTAQATAASAPTASHGGASSRGGTACVGLVIEADA
jgi:hypothetical protein